jgi:hypothetical protein
MIDSMEREAWRKLAEGCPTHVAYRAKRPPQVKCEVCQRMRVTRLLLQEKGLLDAKTKAQS